MKERTPSKNVRISVGGDVSGQIVIGDHNLLIGGIYGGIVNFITPGKQPTFTARARPVYLRPRAFPALLNRKDEQKVAVNALQLSESLSISGENGIGKTALMRYLAYNSPGDNFPDGVVYLSAQGYTVEDLREYIFESFFEGDLNIKPTEAELNRFLQQLRALILLDDLSLNYAEVTQLINSTPQTNFILASAQRCLWGEGSCIELAGLPIQEALVLMERELGRNLREQEKPEAENFCHEAAGHPLLILQAAGMLQHGTTFAELLVRLQNSKDLFVKGILDDLDAAQRQVLLLLAVSGGYSISTQHLKAITQDKNLDAALQKLLDKKLIQAHSPAYSLTGSLGSSIAHVTNLSNWEERLLTHYIGWLKQNPPLPDITDALDLVLNLLEKSNREHRWDDVITLGRGIEKALCLAKRWSAWMRVLELIRSAAQALGNRTIQGWALHQLGTRELCLGNLEAAKETLTQALNIRHALGEKAAAAVTQHNLNLIIAPPAPPRDTPRSGPKPAPKGGGFSPLKVFLAIATLAAVAAAVILGPDLINPPNNTEPAVPVVTTKATIKPPTAKPPTAKPPTKPPPTNAPPTLPPTITITPSLTPTPCGYGIWYCEDFNDNNAKYWELSPAWTIQKDGSNPVLEGSEHNWASLTDHEWTNFRVRFNLRLLSGTIHLNYRIMPDTNGITRYFVGISEQYIYLQKSEYGGGWKELTASDQYFSTNEWHTVEIAGWGNHIAVYIDGELILQYMDDNNYLPSGSIAFETLDYSRAQIDNIEVMDAGEEPRYETGMIGTIMKVDVCLVQGKVLGVTTEYDFDRNGMDYYSFTSASLSSCQQACMNDDLCKAYTYSTYEYHCWLKESAPAQTYGSGLISGIKTCILPYIIP